MAKVSDHDPGEVTVIDELVRSAFEVIAVLSRVAATHDLSLTQLRVLAILRDRRPAIADLAAHLGLERSSVSGLIDRAAQRGLVRREADSADGRSVRVSLTDDGHRLAAILEQQVAERLAPMTDRLRPSDRGRLATLLATMLGTAGLDS